MIGLSSIRDRATMVLVAALCTGAVTALPAQDINATAPGAAQAPSTVLSGPRVQPEWPRFEAAAAVRQTPNSALLASGGSNHTFVFSTLALVIIGALIVVLVLR